MCRKFFPSFTTKLLSSLWTRPLENAKSLTKEINTRHFSGVSCLKFLGCGSHSRLLPNTLYNQVVPGKNRNGGNCLTQSPLVQSVRTVVRYDITSGRKQTVEDVPARFYRLANGLWLRAIAGRERKMWKKHRKRRRRNKQFIFCNKTQSKMLDRMVTMEYKTRKYYPDDPLQQFQERNYCGLKEYPGLGYLRQHQKKFREPSKSTPVADQIHESFGVNRHNPWMVCWRTLRGKSTRNHLTVFSFVLRIVSWWRVTSSRTIMSSTLLVRVCNETLHFSLVERCVSYFQL